MDKEPSLVLIWGLALGIGWAAFAAAREWHWGWAVCAPGTGIQVMLPSARCSRHAHYGSGVGIWRLLRLRLTGARQTANVP